jgi:hypothetical protein
VGLSQLIVGDTDVKVVFRVIVKTEHTEYFFADKAAGDGAYRGLIIGAGMFAEGPCGGEKFTESGQGHQP